MTRASAIAVVAALAACGLSLSACGGQRGPVEYYWNNPPEHRSGSRPQQRALPTSPAPPASASGACERYQPLVDAVRRGRARGGDAGLLDRAEATARAACNPRNRAAREKADAALGAVEMIRGTDEPGE